MPRSPQGHRRGFFDLETRRRRLLVDQSQHRFGVVAIEPGERRSALDRCDGDILFRERLLRLELIALGAQAQFFRTGELLHDPDAAHGHEIARKAESIGAVDRQIVDAQAQHRIRALAGRYGHFTRCLGAVILGSDLTGALDRAALCFGERERRLRVCERRDERERARQCRE